MKHFLPIVIINSIHKNIEKTGENLQEDFELGENCDSFSKIYFGLLITSRMNFPYTTNPVKLKKFRF